MKTGTPGSIELLELLGEGGMGSVWLANVTTDGVTQQVAVKLLNEKGRDDPEMVARQRDEAMLLSLIDHPNVVKLIDLGEVNGLPAVIIDYIEGVNGRQLCLGGRRVPPKAGLQMVAEVADAVHHAHTMVEPQTGKPLGLVHRDLKPSNLLVGVDGRVTLLDFGVARAEVPREGDTRTAVQLGTLRFMAPEQWLYGTVSDKVDVFALGVSLVEMLSGTRIERLPLDHDAYTAAVDDLMNRLDRPAWPESFRRGLLTLVADCLGFWRTYRPTAGDVRDRCLGLMETAPGLDLAEYCERVVKPISRRLRIRGAQAAAECEGKPTAIVMGLAGEVAMEREDATTVVMTKPRRIRRPAMEQGANQPLVPERVRLSIGVGALLVMLHVMGPPPGSSPEVTASSSSATTASDMLPGRRPRR